MKINSIKDHNYNNKNINLTRRPKDKVSFGVTILSPKFIDDITSLTPEKKLPQFQKKIQMELDKNGHIDLGKLLYKNFKSPNDRIGINRIIEILKDKATDFDIILNEAKLNIYDIPVFYNRREYVGYKTQLEHPMPNHIKRYNGEINLDFGFFSEEMNNAYIFSKYDFNRLSSLFYITPYTANEYMALFERRIDVEIPLFPRIRALNYHLCNVFGPLIKKFSSQEMPPNDAYNRFVQAIGEEHIAKF